MKKKKAFSTIDPSPSAPRKKVKEKVGGERVRGDACAVRELRRKGVECRGLLVVV